MYIPVKMINFSKPVNCFAQKFHSSVRALAHCGGEKQSFYSKIIPAGQTTQMIIGASPESDGQILKLTEAL